MPYETRKEEWARKKKEEEDVRKLQKEAFTVGNVCRELGIKSFKKGATPAITRTEFLRALATLDWLVASLRGGELSVAVECMKKTYAHVAFTKERKEIYGREVDYEVADRWIYDVFIESLSERYPL
jgi:hypothetical protein